MRFTKLFMEETMKSIAVFCGSSMPNDQSYIDAALELADIFVKNNYTLVYGGASVGLMGILANRILDQGGRVIGIMPQALSSKEIAHPGLTEMHIVKDMSVRKQELIKASDHFIALPGGCGTMDEIFEVITLNQIGELDKSYGFLNINGFYDGIQTYLNTACDHQLISKQNHDRILFDSNINTFMNSLLK